MALPVGPELGGGRLLVEPFTGADAEEHAARIEHRERRKRLRDGGRVIAIDGARHAGAEWDAAGALAHQRQRNPREHRMALVVLPWLEMVAGPQVAEPRVFGRLGLVDELGSSELFVG